MSKHAIYPLGQGMVKVSFRQLKERLRIIHLVHLQISRITNVSYNP